MTKKNFFEDPRNFKSSIGKSLAVNSAPEAVFIKKRLHMAWKTYPDLHRRSLKGRLTDFNGFRGATWELFFWETLTSSHHEPQIEVSVGATEKSIDFSWLINEKLVMLELTSRSLSQKSRKIIDVQDQLHLYLSRSLKRAKRLIIISIRESTTSNLDMECISREIKGQLKQTLISREQTIFSCLHKNSGWEIEVRLGEEIRSWTAIAPIIFEPLNPEEIDLIEYRNLLDKKFSKFEGVHGSINIVGIVGAHLFPPSLFEAISILYGKPGVQISIDTEDAKAVLMDESFFAPGNIAYSHIAGVLFGFGTIPGFSSLATAIYCLNPNFGYEFDASWLPIEARIIRLEGGLLEELENDGNWTQLDSWF